MLPAPAPLPLLVTRLRPSLQTKAPRLRLPWFSRVSAAAGARDWPPSPRVWTTLILSLPSQRWTRRPVLTANSAPLQPPGSGACPLKEGRQRPLSNPLFHPLSPRQLGAASGPPVPAVARSYFGNPKPRQNADAVACTSPHKETRWNSYLSYNPFGGTARVGPRPPPPAGVPSPCNPRSRGPTFSDRAQPGPRASSSSPPRRRAFPPARHTSRSAPWSLPWPARAAYITAPVAAPPC